MWDEDENFDTFFSYMPVEEIEGPTAEWSENKDSVPLEANAESLIGVT